MEGVFACDFEPASDYKRKRGEETAKILNTKGLVELCLIICGHLLKFLAYEIRLLPASYLAIKTVSFYFVNYFIFCIFYN